MWWPLGTNGFGASVLDTGTLVNKVEKHQQTQETLLLPFVIRVDLFESSIFVFIISTVYPTVHPKLFMFHFCLKR